MARMSPIIVLGAGACCCFVISLIVILSTSLAIVEQSEWCLKYNWWSESVDPQPLTEPGVQMVGMGNYLIRFPNVNRYCYFRDFNTAMDKQEGDSYNPPLQVRTNDGLAITLEFEFVYRLQQNNLNNLYDLVGDDGSDSAAYQTPMVHIAMGVIDTWATTFSAKAFYSDRALVADTFKEKLAETLAEELYIDVQSFQLQPAHFPKAFATSIVQTQENKQDIQVAAQERETRIIQKKTMLENTKSLARKVTIDAEAQAEQIRLETQAKNAQYAYRQRVMAQGYAKALQHFSGGGGATAAGMTNFLSYLKLEALKAHNGTQKLVRLSAM